MTEAKDTVMKHKQVIDLIVAWRKETLKTEPPKTADVADLVISTAEAQAEISFKAGYDQGFLDINNQVADSNFRVGEKQGIDKGRKEIIEWRMEPCPHRSHNAKYFKPRCACEQCWEIKLKEWGL